MGEGLNILEIEITNRCNSSCLHCYANAQMKFNDMPLNLFEKIVPEAEDMDVPMVVLTGGEPLLHPDIQKIIQELHRKKFSVTTFQTNGSLITEDNCGLLSRFSTVQIGYDLPDPEIGVRPNLSDKLIEQKIRLLQDAGLKDKRIVLFVTLHKKNMNKLAVFILRAESLGVRLAFNLLSRLGRAKDHHELWLSSQDVRNLLGKLWKYFAEGRISRPSDPLCVFFYEELQKKALENPDKIVGGCMAGITSLSITPKGNAMPCALLRIPVANLYDDALKEIWQNNPVLDTIRKREYEGCCENCRFINACGGCRARAYYVGASLTGEDPFCFNKGAHQ